MEVETFAFWIAFPFTAAALMWVCYKIAVGKGRSGWWALLGLLHMLGIVVALGLEGRPKSRKVREGSAPPEADSLKSSAGTGDAVPAEARVAPAETDNAETEHHARARRHIKRPNDLVTVFLWYISLPMYVWSFFGPLGFVFGAYNMLVLESPVTVNGEETQSVLAKLCLLGMVACFSAISIAYVVFYRRYRRRRREVYDIRKRRVSRDRSARQG